MTPVARIRLLLGISVPIVLAVPAAGLLLSASATPPMIDLWWRSVIVASRNEPLTRIAHVLDEWGAGGLGFGVVPATIVGVFVLTGRVKAVPGFLIAGVVSLALVQTLKPILDRARPDDMLTISDVGSFPSGHVTNVATLFVFAALVYRKPVITVLAVGYVVLMAWSRSYLSAHWLSDTIAGALWGAALAAVVYSAAAIIVDRYEQQPPLTTNRTPSPQ